MNKPEAKKEDIIIVLLALQKQAFVLGNTIKTLIDKWPTTQALVILPNKNSKKKES